MTFSINLINSSLKDSQACAKREYVGCGTAEMFFGLSSTWDGAQCTLLRYLGCVEIAIDYHGN